MIFLAAVTHDIRTNTLEAVWLEEVLDHEGAVVDFKRVRCQSYSAEQVAEFNADTATTKYAEMAGW